MRCAARKSRPISVSVPNDARMGSRAAKDRRIPASACGTRSGCSAACLAALVSILPALPCGVATAEATAPASKIWLNHFKLGDLSGAADEDWATAAKGLDTAFFALNTLWPMPQPMHLSIPPDEAAAAAAKLSAKGIKIGVECGYFDHATEVLDPADPASTVSMSRSIPKLAPGVGASTARVEIAKLRSLWLAGYPPDYLVLDDPMRRLTVPGQDALGQAFRGMQDAAAAAREVTDYMQAMRGKFPRVKFVVILNFPNWGWKGQPAYLLSPGRSDPLNWGDAHPVMETLFGAVTAAGLSIDAIQADFPWRYFAERPANPVSAMVDWPARLLDLERYARSRGVRFHLTANSETGYVSAESFCEDSLKYLDAYLAAGGMPDRFVVQSWYPHPEQLLPESKPHTGMWLAARFLERLGEVSRGAVPRAVQPVLRAFDRTEATSLTRVLEQLAPTTSADLLQRVRGEWLQRPEEPRVEVAADLLLALRAAVREAAAGKPRVQALFSGPALQPLRGAPPLDAGQVESPVWLLQLTNGSGSAACLAAWVEGAATPPVPPIWVPPSAECLIPLRVPPAAAARGRLTICVGSPDGGPVRQMEVTIAAVPANG